MPKTPTKATRLPRIRVGRVNEAALCVEDYFAARLGAGSPGAPIPANRSASDFVDRTLSLALRLCPAFEWCRCRRFQV